MATKGSAKKRTGARSAPRTKSRRSATQGGAAAAGRGLARARSEGIVVYIHGIGRHAPSDALKLEWDLALFGSDRGDATRMAYWSDILHRNTGATSKRARGAAADADVDLRPAAILAEAGLDPEQKAALQFTSALLDTFGETEASGSARKKVLPLPRFLREPVSRAFLKSFIADTAAYFFAADKRQRIRRRLIDALPADAEEPVTLVAHSQGSIVALEVLAHLRTRLNLVKLVTIGSPLGIREVQDFLDVPPKRRPFFVPDTVKRWHNFADPLDPVALDKGLRGDFVARASGDEGLAAASPITDEVIVNGRTLQIIGFNPHSAVGYLAHPKVRRAVHEAVQFDPMARFVVARDVAESLGTDMRHPVLIEILEPGYHALDESPRDLENREAKERRALSRIVPRGATANGPEGPPIWLADRIARAGKDVEALVRKLAAETDEPPAAAVAAARVDCLRRFVAAHLTPAEIRRIAQEHRDFNVYAVWRSASKKKLIFRSRAVLQADAALESYAANGRDITWAVLDTGIRSDHPHFRDRIAAIWDCTRPGRPVRRATDLDLDGHGSHVAGIIAGSGQHNGKQFFGVAPEARLVVYKVLNDKGEGEDAWIIKALDHIAEQNENKASIMIHGLNLSLGGPYDSTVYGCGFTPICQELRRLWRAGVVVVVACGNEGQLDVRTSGGDVEINTPMSIGDPANLEDCIAVGSVNADRPHLYGVSAFSSRGPTSDGRCKPDVVAPGERISSVNSRYPSRRQGERPYREESGTSMAAPHVSGLLAAFLSARREFRGRPDEVKHILLDACTDIGRDRHHQGRGIPNLMKMLLSV